MDREVKGEERETPGALTEWLWSTSTKSSASDWTESVRVRLCFSAHTSWFWMAASFTVCECVCVSVPVCKNAFSCLICMRVLFVSVC